MISNINRRGMPEHEQLSAYWYFGAEYVVPIKE